MALQHEVYTFPRNARSETVLVSISVLCFQETTLGNEHSDISECPHSISGQTISDYVHASTQKWNSRNQNSETRNEKCCCTGPEIIG